MTKTGKNFAHSFKKKYFRNPHSSGSMSRSHHYTIRNRVFFSFRYSARTQTECGFAFLQNIARIFNRITSGNDWKDSYEGDIQPVWPRSGRGIPHRETIRTQIRTLCRTLRCSWHRKIQLAILLGRVHFVPRVHFCQRESGKNPAVFFI